MNFVDWMFIAFTVIAVFLIGKVSGSIIEFERHQEVCPCKYCINWRKRRDADKELREAK